MRQTVVLVLGRPAAGKSTLARALAASTGLPAAVKDDLKEILYDSVGTGDRAWSMRLGRAAYTLLDYLIELQLRSGTSFIVETPYDVTIAAPRFADWDARYRPRWIQVHCTAPDEILLRRYHDRARSGERHPGHGDELMDEEFAASLRIPRSETFDLPGELLVMDTSVEPTAESVARISALLPPE